MKFFKWLAQFFEPAPVNSVEYDDAADKDFNEWFRA